MFRVLLSSLYIVTLSPQALYHALPMNYITISKLQNKLEGEASITTVRKLIDKMTLDGFIEAKSNRRLGTLKPHCLYLCLENLRLCGLFFHLLSQGGV